MSVTKLRTGRILLWFTVMSGLLCARDAEANWEEHCPERRIRGPVASITQWAHAVDRSIGEPIGAPRKTSEIMVSANLRTVTQISYNEVGGPASESKRFPALVSEYDKKGRLLIETSKLNGDEVFAIKRCHYDGGGRLSLVTQQSKNPDDDKRTITFSYGDSWRRQQWIESYRDLRRPSLLNQATAACS